MGNREREVEEEKGMERRMTGEWEDGGRGIEGNRKREEQEWGKEEGRGRERNERGTNGEWGDGG